MTTITAIPPLPIPNKNTPWRLSEGVFKKATSPDAYSKVEILPTDPEFAFVYTYFHHQTPTNRAMSAAATATSGASVLGGPGSFKAIGT